MDIEKNESFFSSYYNLMKSPNIIDSPKLDFLSDVNFDLDIFPKKENEDKNDFFPYLEQINKILEKLNISHKYEVYYKSLFKKYVQYFFLNFSNINENDIILNKNDIFFPNNIYYYFKKILCFKTEHLNRTCHFFIKILRKFKNDYELNFIDIKFFKRNSIKKYEIQVEKIEKFINFLYNKNDFHNLLIFELIYKFNGFIGGIAKMKVSDISNGLISIYQKNNGLLFFKEIACYKRLRQFILKNKIKSKDYIFHNGNDENINKYINKISKKFNFRIKESKIFDDLKTKRKSSEIFRLFRFFDFIQKQRFEDKEKQVPIKKILDKNNILIKRINIFNKIFKSLEKL